MNAHERLIELLGGAEEASPEEWSEWEAHMRRILARAMESAGEED
jgi:hypothetical protein